MKRRRTSPGQKAANAGTIESLATDVLRRTGELAVACGLSPTELTKLAIDAFAALPEPTGAIDTADLRCLRHAPHALTHWHTEPSYVDEAGKPRRLPLRGKVSMTSLAAAVSPSMSGQELVDFLERYGAIERAGTGWIPLTQSVILSGNRAHQSARGLLLIRGVLRNKAHNAAVGRSPEGWFERLAENAHIPKSQRAILYRNIDGVGAQLLTHIDLEMKRREEPSLPPDEKTHVAVGVYLYEDDLDL